ncbi:MAG: cytochrome c biogenesis protein CcdA [Flavobacteriaceae bacterium]|nr:cytochrome c biogenesis protein CcdA [Flavobacteriaceae bacterium]
MKNIFSLFFSFFLFINIGFSQDPVSFTTKVNTISKNQYELIISSKIDSNWRLYSQFLIDGGALPTEFIFKNISNDSYILIGNTIESESITKFDPIFNLDQTYFIDSNTFKQVIEVKDLNLDKVFATIAYQACDDAVCIFRESDLVFNLDGSSEIILNEDLTALVSDDSNPLVIDLKNKELLENYSEENNISGNNYFDLLILGFLGGLLALLTPCVFPMIPLTVSFFTNKKTQSSSSFNAIIYGLFIVFIYLFLSIPFHFVESLDPEILNSISTNALLNVFFFIVFIIFAFSFFGFYEITIPSSWINSIDSKSNSIGGFIGIFFMALTLVLVSFSCTGPILGSLLVGSISSQGGALQLSIGMLGFGIALALPFTVFALFPNMLKSLPKSGRWMNTFKIILGFLELGFAFKFLSNADLVEHWGLIKREIFIAIWVIISILLSLYLIGVYKFPNESHVVKRSKFNMFLSLSFLSFAIYLSPALLPNGSNSARLLSGFTPPSFYSIYPKSNDCPLGFNCFKDFDKGLQHAKEINKPILLDFTGWACVNCRRVEENIWTDPVVFDLINNNYVLISLYVDDRKELEKVNQLDLKYKSGKIKEIRTIGDKSATFQALNFKSASQPYYVLLDPNLKILNSPIQYTTKNVYQEWLEEGLKAFK